MYTDSARGRWVNNLQPYYINSGYRGTEWRWTGRPKLTRTQEREDATAKALRKYARKTERDLYEISADIAWGLEEFEDIPDVTRLKAIVFLDSCTEVAEGSELNHTPPEPGVYLPEKKPDMAKSVDIRGQIITVD